MNTRTKTAAEQTDATDGVAPAEQAPARTKRVIFQRPAGNQDLGTMLGLNDFCQYIPFDKEVELPAEVVDYFRAEKVVNYFAGQDGQPVASYSAKFNILDA